LLPQLSQLSLLTHDQQSQIGLDLNSMSDFFSLQILQLCIFCFVLALQQSSLSSLLAQECCKSKVLELVCHRRRFLSAEILKYDNELGCLVPRQHQLNNIGHHSFCFERIILQTSV
jgi:hypothetical protein